jgi:hypothetical protein
MVRQGSVICQKLQKLIVFAYKSKKKSKSATQQTVELQNRINEAQNCFKGE